MKPQHIKRFVIGFVIALAGVATAATFNLFQPATGILKGNASTYVTTAATSTDLIGTFSGTCNNGTYLRGDGACNTPPGTGVSSVALTMPTGFSVGGSPVTSSGTLAVTTTLTGPLRGNGSGIVADSLSGVLKGNGTAAITTAAGTDVAAVFTGTCNSTTFLRGDGSCQAPGGGSVTSVGSGTGVTASPNPIVSTGTLAVDQSFSPTWTGTHTFNIPVAGAGANFSASATTFVIAKSTTATNLASVRALSSINSLMGLCISHTGGVCVAGSSADEGVLYATNGIRFSNDSGTTYATLSTGGVFNAVGGLQVNGTNVCQSSGTNCPGSTNVFAYAKITVVANTSCSVSGTYASAHVTSCTWNATGSYSVTVSGFTTVRPVCTTIADSGPVIINADATSTTNVNVHSYDATGVAQESNFQLHCIGT